MESSLFSPYWYRVESLRPQLRSHARIYRHHYRGERWYVLQDPSAGRNHRLSPAAYYLIALMDGYRTANDIWEAATTHLGDEAPTQGETIRLFAQLHAADVMRCDATPDTLEIFGRFTQGQKSSRMSRYLNPLFARFPLLDPDAFLERGLPFVRPLFTAPGFIVWSCVVAIGVLLAAMNWSALASAAESAIFDPRNAAILAVTYIVVKALHELGHAFATKVWGGEVHEVGVTLLVLVPLPYVDASSAWAFGSKWRRVIVGAAGMMVELFLAALALLLWLKAEPGVVRTIAYDVMLIGGVSTLFFNGNPLLRFDGYYVLSDILEIPNLSARSRKYLAYLLQHYLLGLEERRHEPMSPGEQRWFVVYGTASSLYRPLITIGIALFIAGKFFIVGVLLAFWGLAIQIVLPVARGLDRLRSDPRVRRQPVRVAAAAMGLVVAVVLALFVLPIPSWTRTEGVVWLPDHSQVRAGDYGFVRRVLARPDSSVVLGQALIETVDPMLRTRVNVLEARLREVKARYHLQRQQDPVRAEILAEEIETIAADLAHASERADAGLIRSSAYGRFVLPRAESMPGRFVKRGEVLGYVASFKTPIVRTLVSQADIALVRDRTHGVGVRLADRLGEVVPATIVREVPSATVELPTAALGASGGGAVPVDTRDSAGLTAAAAVFQLDLMLPPNTPVSGVGSRVYVRFDHGTEPLAERIYRTLRRVFMGRLNV
jgi:putative peptide zinc metalloprotease protein